MRSENNPNEAAGSPVIGNNAYLALFAFGIVAPVVTFAIAISELERGAKVTVLSGMVLLYAAVSIWSYTRLKAIESTAVHDRADRSAADEIDENEAKLAALEEANEFFGSSLKPADMFRLVSSRVREIFPHSASLLLLPDESGSRLTVRHSDGEDSNQYRDVAMEIGQGVPGLAFLSGEVEMAPGMTLKEGTASRSNADEKGWSISVPLFRGGAVFAVFHMFTSRPVENSSDARSLLIAISERISPLFLSSLAYERSLTDALTDPLTKLPNERALYMVLENQLAESQRFRDERPLSVLAVEISDFEEANEYLGSAAGEELVKFTGDTLRGSLRKMDFLARTYGDEFVIILPTANETTTLEIIERIKESFASTPFSVSEHENLKIWLTFGAASFWEDGETAQQLLRTARLKKQQAGAEGSDNVLWFDKDYVN